MATNDVEDPSGLAKPIKRNGTYENPFPTWKFFKGWDVMKWMASSTLQDTSGVPRGNQEVGRYVQCRIIRASARVNVPSDM